MAKKQDLKESSYIEALEKTNVLKVRVEDEMKKSFISYAMAVNISRAIPDVRDGLKPVHRRILFAMEELNLYPDKSYRKCARIVGDVLGKYHPHGETAVYDALVRMAQDFSINHPLVDGQGNFGSVDGDSPAAQRYTEAKLSKISVEMLKDIEKETVDFYPNFDETLLQPTVLPSRYPNILVNGADGIAVGMATNIPPHNLGEIIDGTIAIINDPEISFEDLTRIIPAPDYPTGGILMGRMAIRSAYKTGRGGVVIRAKADIEEQNGRSRIVITELPYQVNKARLIENIADMVKDKKLEGISDIREESDRTGMRLVIEVKKDANAQVVLNSLYLHTQLQISNGITLLALADGQPKILNLKEILQYYIAHQQEVTLRRTRFDYNKAAEKHHIVSGLIIALDNIDRVIAIIKASQDKQVAATRLMEEFSLSDKQAAAILNMPLSRLTNLEVNSLRNELCELEKLMAELKAIMDSPTKVNEIIIQELGIVRDKYAVPRKTEISEDCNEILIGDLIEKEDVVISMTHFGYIKRIATTEYRTQRRGGIGVTAHKTKEEDFVENMFVTNTHDDLLFFTNFGKVYSIKAYEVPEANKTARGRAIVNLLQLEEKEKVTAVIPIKEGTTGNMFLATKNGLVKKTNLSEFASIRKVGKIAISLVEDDELISANFTSGSDELIMATSEGKCIRFSEEDVRPTGRGSQGVRSIKLDKGDVVVDMTILKEGYQILTVSSKGYGKRTDMDEYNLQSRAGKGVKAGVFNDRTGKLVNLKLVHEDDDVMLIADNGVIIRVPVKEISIIGRNTQGVRIMKFRDDEANVVCVANTPAQEKEENETDETNTENTDNAAADNSSNETAGESEDNTQGQ